MQQTELNADATTAGNGLVAAYLLDGQGGATEISWDGVRDWRPEDGVLWVHLERAAPETAAWMTDGSGLNPIAQEALMATESRPRMFVHDGGLQVNLRGVNLNPGANPEDMVGLRLWIEDHRVISVRQRRLMAINSVRERLHGGRGPRTTGDFLAQISDALVERMVPVISELRDRVDESEESIDTLDSATVRANVYEFRHQAILLRRYLAPQRDVLSRLQLEDHAWLSQRNRMELREVTDRTMRFVEELDEVRERSVLLKDELLAMLSEKTNRTMYLLTLVAAIMLPLSFLTGLLGINVKGIPGAETDWAFLAVCGLLVAIGAVQIVLFRKWKWL